MWLIALTGCGALFPPMPVEVDPPDWDAPQRVDTPWFAARVPGGWVSTPVPGPNHPGDPGEVHFLRDSQACFLSVAFRSESDPRQAAAGWQLDHIDTQEVDPEDLPWKIVTLHREEDAVTWAGQEGWQLRLDTRFDTWMRASHHTSYRVVALPYRDQTMVLAQGCHPHRARGTDQPGPTPLELMEDSFQVRDAPVPSDAERVGKPLPVPVGPPPLPEVVPSPEAEAVALRPGLPVGREVEETWTRSIDGQVVLSSPVRWRVEAEQDGVTRVVLTRSVPGAHASHDVSQRLDFDADGVLLRAHLAPVLPIPLIGWLLGDETVPAPPLAHQFRDGACGMAADYALLPSDPVRPGDRWPIGDTAHCQLSSRVGDRAEIHCTGVWVDPLGETADHRVSVERRVTFDLARGLVIDCVRDTREERLDRFLGREPKRTLDRRTRESGSVTHLTD